MPTVPVTGMGTMADMGGGITADTPPPITAVTTAGMPLCLDIVAWFARHTPTIRVLGTMGATGIVGDRRNQRGAPTSGPFLRLWQSTSVDFVHNGMRGRINKYDLLF